MGPIGRGQFVSPLVAGVVEPEDVFLMRSSSVGCWMPPLRCADTEEWILDDKPDNARGWQPRRGGAAGVAAALLLGLVAAACSTPQYQPLGHETDLTGAYALAFQAACDLDCGSGRVVYVVVSPSEPEVTTAIVDSTTAQVTTVISPIALRDRLVEGEVAIVFTIETAVLSGDVAVVRVGRSEVTSEISTYIGRDYLVSLETGGRWVLRTSEDTGITTTTAIS